jgi:hypothetical protein
MGRDQPRRTEFVCAVARRYEAFSAASSLGRRWLRAQHLTTAVAEHNQPFRVLGYQGLVQRASDVEPLFVGVDVRRMSAHFCQSRSWPGLVGAEAGWRI